MTLSGGGGIWLFDVKTGKRTFVLEGEQIGAPVWLPDGRTWLFVDGAFSDLSPSARKGIFRVTIPDLDTVLGR
jgi:hypothetical protein